MKRSSWPCVIALAAVLAPLPAFAERTQVFSLQGAESADGTDKVKAELAKVRGFKKAELDKVKAELTVRLEDGVADADVLAAIERAGLTAVAGAGHGGYVHPPDYPAGADVVRLTNDGQKVGPLKKLRVPGKHTVFDVYADWCGPCRQIDESLRGIVAARQDVAVRKLNVVDFDSPLALELGSDFEGLPYLVVFSPKGTRTAIRGANVKKLEEALARP